MRKALLLLTIVPALAQAQFDGFFVRVSGGPSIPMEDFARMEIGEGTGYANTGTHIGLDLGYGINRYVGLIAEFSMSHNSIDEKKFGNDALGGIDVLTTADGWRTVYAMPGVYAGVNEGRIGFYFKAQAGVAIQSANKITLSTATGDATIEYRPDNDVAYALAFVIPITFSDHFQIFVEPQYTGVTIDHDVFFRSPNGFTGESNEEITYQRLNLKVGVGFSF